MRHHIWDIAIIGGGIIGLATARELLRRYPALRVAVVEKEAAIGQHQTGHNSGVIHSGIYYAPGSLKARLCVAGKAKLQRFCDERGIPYELCGKVIVATDEEELPRLEQLYQRGLANGVAGLEMIGPERLRELEPACVGIRALHSPQAGIIDFGHVARALAEDVLAQDGAILTGHEVTAIDQHDRFAVLLTSQDPIPAKRIIACAGLHADRVAMMTGAPRGPQIVPFRGDYYVLRPERRDLVRSMIYPVPDPRFPFLGVHLSRRIDGAIWLGPNAVLAFAREGYSRLDLNPRDLWETLRFRGFQTLAARYWRIGAGEMWRDFSKRAFLAALRRYVPDLTLADLLPGPAGVRAQALDASGGLVDDFIVHQQGNTLHVRNAPSPAATSSLAIGEMIADTATSAFELDQSQPSTSRQAR